MPENGELEPVSPENEQPPSLLKNLTSLVGIAIALVAAANIAFLVFIDLMSEHPSPYIGIFAYMLMPGLMVLGLVLIPIGMLWERHRRRKHAPSVIPKFPRIDLNNPQQRATFAGSRGVHDGVCSRECGGQLSRVRIHRFRAILRTTLSQRNEAGIRCLSAIAACSRSLRGLPCRRRRRMVCEIEIVRRVSALRRGV